MSLPAAAPPPAPAPAAVPAVPPPAAPAAPAAPETGAQDPQLKSIFDDLGVVLETPSSAAPAPAATGTPAPPPAPAGAPPAQPHGTPPGGAAVAPPGPAPAPPGSPPGALPPVGTPPGTQTPPPGVTVRREKPIAKVVEEVLRKVMGESPQPAAPSLAAPAPTHAPPPAEDPFLATMVPEEKEAYELAKWAEENVPEYKGQGLSGKFLGFYKAVDQYITAERAKDPNRKFDDDDEAFQSFVQSSRPEVEPSKWERLKTDRLVAQVEERTTKAVSERFSRENEELKERQTLLEKRPIIEGRLHAFRDNIGKLMTADAASPLAEIAKKIGTDGVEKAIEADPLFTPIVVTAYNHGEVAAAEFLAMSNGVKAYSPDNQVQDWLIRFIRRSGEVFAEKGGDRRVRTDNGTSKTFLPRGKYNELRRNNPAESEKHWTFSDEDVLQMLERNTKDHISALVKDETDRLAKAGYVRTAPAAAPVSGTPNPPAPNGAPAPAAPPPQPVGSPQAGVSSAPGQGSGGVAQQYALGDNELAILGIPRKTT